MDTRYGIDEPCYSANVAGRGQPSKPFCSKADDETVLSRKGVGDAPQDVPVFRRRDSGDLLSIGVFNGREEGVFADFLARFDLIAIDAVSGSRDPEISVDDRRLAPFGRRLVDHAQKLGEPEDAVEMIGDVDLFDETDASGFGEGSVLPPPRPAGAAPRRL